MELFVAMDKDGAHVRAEFDPFFRTHFDRVARAAALVTGDPSTGQDVAQDAFVRLHDRWDRFESTDHARNFAYKVAMNLARSHVRKYLRLVPSGLHHADQVAASTMDPPDDWYEVAGALAALPARQRACLVLSDYVDLDSEHVGRILGIRAPTVRVHLMRARQAVRERLGLPAMEADDDDEG